MNLTFEEIEKLRPEFEFGGQEMRMVDWFIVERGHMWCHIRSGLRHANGETKSPFYCEFTRGGENADEIVLQRFNDWWREINYKPFKT